MATSNLYLYKTVYELTMFDNGQRLEGPMYNNTIKIHKGIDDKITFNVYDENRRLASISHLTLAVNIIDANSGALVLTKVPIVNDNIKGTLDVTFSWGDTANLDAGLYEFSITTTDIAGETSALYTDLSQRAIRCAAFIWLQQNRISRRWITFYGVKNSNSRDNLRCNLSGEIFFHYEKIMAEG